MTTLRPHRVILIAVGLLAWSCFTVRAQEEEPFSNALTAVDIIRLGDPDDDMIVGEAGSNYPTYAEVPNTAFSCEQQGFPGYYADQETQCQVFHICVTQGRRLEQFSFLCPNGTIFNQQYLVCVWWYDFDCGQASALYNINADIFGDAPSDLPGNFIDDITGTAAASAPRGRPTASRFPGGLSGDGGDKTGAAERLPFSQQDGSSTRERFPTIGSDLGSTGGLTLPTGTQGTRDGSSSLGGEQGIRGLPTSVLGQGTRGGSPFGGGNQGTREGLPSGAGQGSRGGLSSGAASQGTGGGFPFSSGGQGSTGRLPFTGSGQGSREGLPSSVGGQSAGGRLPSSLAGQDSRGGLPGLTASQGSRGGLPTSSADQALSNLLPTAQGSTGRLPSPADSVGVELPIFTSRPDTPERFTSQVSGTGALGGLPSRPGTSGFSTDTARRPDTTGGATSGLVAGGPSLSLLSDDAGTTGGFPSSPFGSNFGISQPSTSGASITPGTRPVVSPGGIRGTGAGGQIVDLGSKPSGAAGLTSPVRETVTPVGFTGLPSRTGTTGGSIAGLATPGLPGSLADTDLEFSPLISDTAADLGSAGPGISPTTPGQFTGGLGSSGFSGQITGPGATSGFVSAPGRPSIADGLTRPSSRPGITGSIGSSASPAAFAGRPGITGLSSESLDDPSTSGGFISSLGTPGITGGFTASPDDLSLTGGLPSSPDRPGTSVGISGISGTPEVTGDIAVSSGSPSFAGGVTSSADRPDTTIGTTGSSGRPVATGNEVLSPSGKPSTTGFVSDGPAITAGFPGSVSAPGVDQGIAVVGDGILDPTSGQGISDFTSLAGRPGITSVGETLPTGISSRFPNEETTDGLLSSLSGKPAVTSVQSSVGTDFGSSPIVSDTLSEALDSITAQLDPAGVITSPGISDSFASSISSTGTPGASPVQPSFEGSFETFPGIVRDTVDGFDSSVGTVGFPGADAGNIISGTETGQYGQGGLQDQEQAITQQGLAGLQLFQGQDGSPLGQVSGIDPIQGNFGISQGIPGQDQAYTELQGQGPTQGLVTVGQGQSGLAQSLGQTLTGVSQVALVSGQVDIGQRETLGDFVQGQGQPGFSTANQGNEGYSYPAPSTSLVPGLGITSATESQSTGQGNIVLIAGNQESSFPTQHNNQGSEVTDLQGLGIIGNNDNVLFSQGNVATQQLQEQTSQVTGNNILDYNNNNNDNVGNTILVVTDFPSTVDVSDQNLLASNVGNLASNVGQQNQIQFGSNTDNQNQFLGSSGSLVSGGEQSLQGYDYNNPSVASAPLPNSFSINANQFLSKPGSQSEISNGLVNTTPVPNAFTIQADQFLSRPGPQSSAISNGLSVNVASGIGSIGSGITQQFSTPTKEYSSGLTLPGNELNIARQPQSGTSINNQLSASPVSLTDSLKQEVVAPVTHAKPIISFNSPLNSLSAVDLTALQQGYLPPSNELPQSGVSSFVPSNGLSLPSSSPFSSTLSVNLPDTSSSGSLGSTLFGSLGSQSSTSSGATFQDSQLFGSTGSQVSASFPSTISQGSFTSSSSNTKPGTSSFIFPTGSQSSTTTGGVSFTSTSLGSSLSSPSVSSGTQGSSSSSLTFSPSPSSSQGNNNIGGVTLQGSSPINLGYLPPVGENARNIRQVVPDQNKIYVTPVPNVEQKPAVSEQRSNRAFKPSVLLKNDKDTSEFMPKSSHRFSRIFFPSSRRSDGLPITYVDNTRRSFVATSSSPFNPYNKYVLSWRS